MAEQIPKRNILEETETSWQTGHKPAGCLNCKRVFLVPMERKNTTCPICHISKLDPQPANLTIKEPEKLLPFKISQSNLNHIYAEFTSGIWLKPEDFNTESLLKRTQPLYWPMWLVDSDIEGHWQMEAGFDYKVQSAKEVFSGGEWHSRKEIENRIRWEPRLGTAEIHVDNICVPALEEHHNRQQMTGGYSLDRSLPFNIDQLGNAILEVPDLSPREAWRLARPQVQRELGRVCKSATNADHQRDFAIQADYHQLNWTQLLLPMLTTHYQDDEGQPQVLVVNGVTGGIKGPRLASRKRGLRLAGILAAIAGAILLLALLSLALTAVFPPAGLIGALFGVIGLGVGLFAIIPAIWPGQHNRKQRDLRIIRKSS